MSSLSFRRVDNAPRYCRLLRTFDSAGDCRVNFSGVCCIVAREYGGRRSAATREGCLGYGSFSSRASPRFFLSPFTRAPCVTRAARALATFPEKISNYRLRKRRPRPGPRTPRRAVAETRATPPRRRTAALPFLLSLLLLQLARRVSRPIVR